MPENCCTESKEKKEDTFGESIPTWVCGSVETPVGKVKQVSTMWSKPESIGQLKCRISNSFRMNYKVEPGLYATGNANKESPVFISANYKLSFDILRREINGLDAWILVLDTKGINVWCAAGKETFGTEELIKKITDAKLDQVVNHRRIVVPQLGASHLHSYIVKKETGFTVSFGPIYAEDIKAYINNGCKASKEMRRVRFSMLDRMVLTPMEITALVKYIGIYVIAVLIFFGLQPNGILFKGALTEGCLFVILGLIALFIGAYLTPILLPFIPFRSFAIKGLLLGLIPVILLPFFIDNAQMNNIYFQVSTFLFFPAISSYLALNFTGCTPFTNLSGVVKEMKFAIPGYIAALIISAISLIMYKLVSWGMV